MFENCLPKASAHIARENIAWEVLKLSWHLAVVIQSPFATRVLFGAGNM